MKRAYFLVLILIILLFATGCGDNTKTIESLSELVFKSLQRNDYSLFENAVLQEDQLPEMLNMMGFTKERDKIELEKEYNTKYLPQIRESFNSVIKKAERKKIDLNEATVIELEYDIQSMGVVQETDVEIIFEYKGERHEIFMKNCMKFKDGWVIMEEIKLR